MALTTTGNINNGWQVLQTWLDRTVLDNFEPELRFYDMGQKGIRRDGYQTLAWTRPNQLVLTPAQTLLTEGITPTETNLVYTTVSMQAQQYGLYVTLTDILIDVMAVPVIANAAEETGRNLARVVDQVIQSNLDLNLTASQVLFAGTAVSRATITATDLLRARDLARAFALLSTNAAPIFDGDAYVSVMHPNVIYDVQQEAGTGTFIDINKYSKPMETMSGEIGMLFGVRVVRSAFVQTFASVVTVYPTYVFSRKSYGVADLQSMQTFITPRAATDSNPLAQRVKVGAKIAFGNLILYQKGIVRIESASSLSFVRWPTF